MSSGCLATTMYVAPGSIGMPSSGVCVLDDAAVPLGAEPREQFPARHRQPVEPG